MATRSGPSSLKRPQRKGVSRPEQVEGRLPFSLGSRRRGVSRHAGDVCPILLLASFARSGDYVLEELFARVDGDDGEDPGPNGGSGGEKRAARSLEALRTHQGRCTVFRSE